MFAALEDHGKLAGGGGWILSKYLPLFPHKTDKKNTMVDLTSSYDIIQLLVIFMSSGRTMDKSSDTIRWDIISEWFFESLFWFNFSFLV